MSKTKKALTTTLGLTVILFGFIVFLLYVIYCYAYYDKYLEYEYANSFNNRDYSFVYEKMVGKGNLTYEQFIKSIDNIIDKDRLEDIFDTYYKDSGLYNKEEFLNTYLYEVNGLTEENIKFSTNGNTNLFTRRAIFYDEIKISNEKDSVVLGVFNKVTFNVENNSVLRIDNKDLECSNGVCVIDKMYGGIYAISYISNGYEYYGLVNVNKDKQSINVTNLDSLVKVKEVKVELGYGRYLLTDCKLDNCPSLNSSYLMINEDGSYYLYNDYDKNSTNRTGNFTLNSNYILFDEGTKFIISGTNLVEENNNIVYSYNN